MTAIQRRQPLASSVGQGFGGAEMREGVSISLEDVELVRGQVFVIASEGPSPRFCGGVSRREIQSANRDTEVEVAKDELDASGAK